MYRGRLAEQGPTTAVLNSPGHVYTQILVSAIPGDRQLHSPARPAESTSRFRATFAPTSGCIFADRCPRALPECAADPPVVEITPGHRATCVLADRTGGSRRANGVARAMAAGARETGLPASGGLFTPLG
jgi:oligopeptide/dipeptide ABC transporter ATP-binding protein